MSKIDYELIRGMAIMLDSVIESQGREGVVWDDFRFDRLSKVHDVLGRIVAIEELELKGK